MYNRIICNLSHFSESKIVARYIRFQSKMRFIQSFNQLDNTNRSLVQNGLKYSKLICLWKLMQNWCPIELGAWSTNGFHRSLIGIPFDSKLIRNMFYSYVIFISKEQDKPSRQKFKPAIFDFYIIILLNVAFNLWTIMLER